MRTTGWPRNACCLALLLAACQGCFLVSVQHPTFRPAQRKSSDKLLGQFEFHLINRISREQYQATPAGERSIADASRYHLGTVLKSQEGAVLRFAPAPADLPQGFLLISADDGVQPAGAKTTDALGDGLVLVDELAGDLILQIPCPKKDAGEGADGDARDGAREQGVHVQKTIWPAVRAWDPQQVMFYLVVKLSPVDDGFEGSVLSYEFVADAITDGKLAGHDPDPEANIGHVYQVDAEPEEWRAFVAAQIDKGLFDPTPVFKLQRRE